MVLRATTSLFYNRSIVYGLNARLCRSSFLLHLPIALSSPELAIETITFFGRRAGLEIMRQRDDQNALLRNFDRNFTYEKRIFGLIAKTSIYNL